MPTETRTVYTETSLDLYMVLPQTWPVALIFREDKKETRETSGGFSDTKTEKNSRAEPSTEDAKVNSAGMYFAFGFS